MILVITNGKDLHGQRVAENLVLAGKSVQIIDYSAYPLELEISRSYGRGRDEFCIRQPDGTLVTSSDVKSVLNRRPASPTLPKGIRSRRIRDYMMAEARAIIDSMPQLLDCFWVNHPDVIRVAGRKPYQLRIAEEIGFAVPRTLITNSPKELRNFVLEAGDQYVLKPVYASGVNVIEDGRETRISFYTKRLSSDEVLGSADMVSNTPVICQEYVEKAYELRVTVVGREIFSCEIHSQSSEVADEDWRKYDVDNTPHRVGVLADSTRARILKLMERLGLVFGCIDLVVTPSGEVVFLEINPNGQWLWIEELTGLPITDGLAQMLEDPPAGDSNTPGS